MKSLTLLLFLAAFSFSVFGQSLALPGILLTVNQTGDSSDAIPGNSICADANGQCTLRAAIEEANARPGQDVINFDLPDSSVINLTRGELAITSIVSIVGPGARKLTVQRSDDANTPNFRIFNVPVNSSPAVVIRGLKIKNGNAAAGQSGGAINIESGNGVALTELAISDNSASAHGGAIFNAGTLTLTRSLVNSDVSGSGGGVFNFGSASTAIISDSTLTDNRAGIGGGLVNEGKLVLANVTISRNTAASTAADIVSRENGTITAVNTLVAGTSAASTPSITGVFVSLGNNLITDAGDATGFTNGTNGDQVSDDNQLDPLLGELTDNGGQTDTRALLSGSPAINHGSNCIRAGNCGFPTGQNVKLNFDQRPGYQRVGQSVADIGAYEVFPPSISTSVGFGSHLANTKVSPINSLAVLTDVRTGAKYYRVINQFGYYSFNNLPFSAFILEIRSKRSGISQASVLNFDDLFSVPAFKGEIRNENSVFTLRPVR